MCDHNFDYEERFRVDRRKLEHLMIGSDGRRDDLTSINRVSTNNCQMSILPFYSICNSNEFLFLLFCQDQIMERLQEPFLRRLETKLKLSCFGLQGRTALGLLVKNIILDFL